jgi:hypothetical protein
VKTVSKIKLLLDVVDNLRSLADSIQAAVEAMQTDELIKPIPQDGPAPEAKSISKSVSLEQVRAVLAEKSQAGFIAEVRGLLEKYGAPKLSQIEPANYEALLADAEALK